MARDYANKPRSGTKRKQPAARKKAAAKQAAPVSHWRWYGAGVLTGLFLAFLLYLGIIWVLRNLVVEAPAGRAEA